MKVGKNCLNHVMKAGFLFLAAFTIQPSVFAAPSAVMQDDKQTISGRITAKNGDPIPGAYVVEAGTNNGVVTDFEGNYTLTVSIGASVEVSFLGFKTTTLKANGAVLNVILEDDAEMLDELVVIGYGTQRKGDLTSAISSVKESDFVQGAAQDAAQLMRGKVAGLNIVMTDGDPSTTSQIMLRGVGSIKAGSAPLVIIDGVPGDLNTVAPEDIASIDVVKDGSAAAIYGTRGNNGVIYISTKKVNGQMPATIEVHTYFTAQTIKNRLDTPRLRREREPPRRYCPDKLSRQCQLPLHRRYCQAVREQCVHHPYQCQPQYVR